MKFLWILSGLVVVAPTTAIAVYLKVGNSKTSTNSEVTEGRESKERVDDKAHLKQAQETAQICIKDSINKVKDNPVGVKQSQSYLSSETIAYTTTSATTQQAIIADELAHKTAVSTKQSEVQNKWTAEHDRLKAKQTSLQRQITDAQSAIEALKTSNAELKEGIDKSINNFFLNN